MRIAPALRPLNQSETFRHTKGEGVQLRWMIYLLRPQGWIKVALWDMYPSWARMWFIGWNSIHDYILFRLFVMSKQKIGMSTRSKYTYLILHRMFQERACKLLRNIILIIIRMKVLINLLLKTHAGALRYKRWWWWDTSTSTHINIVD